VPLRQGAIEIVTPRMVRGLRERNVRLDVWTINDEAEMRRLLAWAWAGSSPIGPTWRWRCWGGDGRLGLRPRAQTANIARRSRRRFVQLIASATIMIAKPPASRRKSG
jgi:hypothetical protein